MDAQLESICQFLVNSGNVFVPVYQRDYAWNTDQCQKLWEDLVELKDPKKGSHFLGTIVNIYHSLHNSSIVDGQQRLITVSLILLALQNYLNKAKQDEDSLKEQLNEFLINKHSKDKLKRIRLKPNKQDAENFNQLFEENAELKNDTNIVNNYQFFYKHIESKTLSPREIFEACRKLEIVNIELKSPQDDPQLIFASLNSTGLDLTDGDLIRNYILMDIEPATQEQLYSQYWGKIEHLVGKENKGNKVAEFVRNFLMFKLTKKVTQSKRAPYLEFKKYVETNHQTGHQRNSAQVLEELLYYAKIYSYFITQEEHPDKNINRQLERLCRLEFSVAYPFLFDVFELCQKDILNKNTVAEIIKIIESYVFRRIFVTSTTQGLNQFFPALSKEIKNLAPDDQWKSEFLNILHFVIKNKTASQKCPTDEEFSEALVNKEVYELSSKNKNFLLESLEDYNSAYTVDLTDLTVEHIMPQKINSKWKEALGDNWEEVHAQYLHTLGNLTWTSQNSELSNKDFQEKQNIDLHKSKLKLSYTLSDIKDWNKDAILARSKTLAEEALKIWPYPQTSFEKSIPESTIYLLSDDNLDLTNTKPKSIIIEDNSTKLKSWREVKKILCRKFYHESPTEFRIMVNDPEFKKYFSSDKNSLWAAFEVGQNIYVETHDSTQVIIQFAKKITKYFDFDQDEIGFELRQ